MTCVDLHTHSRFSDGTDSPGELLEQAELIGLAAVALTDHDTTAGLGEFLAAARLHPGVEAIAGVEISTLFSARELHFVGLFIDPADPELAAFLAEMRENRRRRNEAIKAKLHFLGYPVEWSDPAFGGLDPTSAGRPHFARVLVEHYGFPTMQSVFDKLLKNGCPAYVRRELPDPSRAIAAIHAAGGVAVWAHPVYRERNERAFVRRVLKRFAPLGLDAAEAYYSMFGPPETALMLEMTSTFGLAVSGGSDYHGKNSPAVALGEGAGGLRVPAEVVATLREKSRIYQPGK
ncbi:MAG: PHP domain-containing protein [Victivallaceae bacterium]|nr:PHP domain-containing protein [Victivallaceae bacterium]